MRPQQKILHEANVAADRRSPDYLRRFVDSEIEKNAKPIKAAGIAIDRKIAIARS